MKVSLQIKSEKKPRLTLFLFFQLSKFILYNLVRKKYCLQVVRSLTEYS